MIEEILHFVQDDGVTFLCFGGGKEWRFEDYMINSGDFNQIISLSLHPFS
jgi:hypothetical protein